MRRVYDPILGIYLPPGKTTGDLLRIYAWGIGLFMVLLGGYWLLSE